MYKLLQLLNKNLSVQTTVSIVLAVIVIYWIFNRYALEFFAVLFALLVASAGMFLYLVIAWRKLRRSERRSIGLSILAWLLVFYVVVHANGLTIRSILWWQ